MILSDHTNGKARNSSALNTLRLWSSCASDDFLSDYLNHGDYERACEEKSRSSRISQVLFPDEDIRRATDLRMKQQYFFICATLQDIIRRYKIQNRDISDIDKKINIHLEGSRCALAIPELIRILVDEERIPWATALEMTQNIFSYTSHALAREDSENWPVYKVEQLLPRHMQIIYDVNLAHLEEVRKKYGQETTLVRDLSLIEEGEVKRIRFADVAVLCSRSVTGVSHEQTSVLTKKIFAPFAAYFPDRFNCKVSGVGQRRWILSINRPLAHVITRALGDKWVTQPELLSSLEKYADDHRFLDSIAFVKREAKIKLARPLGETAGFQVDESMMFDVQTGKIHTNKRQLLHILYLLGRYLRIKNGETAGARRVHIFAGKAAPSDFLAKQIIHLISAIADRINRDPHTSGLMRIVFVPNFTMTWAELIAPAVDLSEQLSTATLEPSGTFNMKFAMNGAVAIASQSGANIEMAERIGAGHMFTFGKNAADLAALRDYRPGTLLASHDQLKAILAFLENDLIPSVDQGHAIFPLLASLRDSDRQFVLLDFDDYCAKQDLVDARFGDPLAWSRSSLCNIARAGWFSSDRLVNEYARDIWKVSCQ